MLRRPSSRLDTNVALSGWRRPRAGEAPMLEVTTTARLVDYATLEDRGALMASVQRSELESALNSRRWADLWLEIADGDETRRLTVELPADDVEAILGYDGRGRGHLRVRPRSHLGALRPRGRGARLPRGARDRRRRRRGRSAGRTGGEPADDRCRDPAGIQRRRKGADLEPRGRRAGDGRRLECPGLGGGQAAGLRPRGEGTGQGAVRERLQAQGRGDQPAPPALTTLLLLKRPGSGKLDPGRR